MTNYQHHLLDQCEAHIETSMAAFAKMTDEEFNQHVRSRYAELEQQNGAAWPAIKASSVLEASMALKS
jgi:hypothetical protein